jgi:hypothetical protein
VKFNARESAAFDYKRITWDEGVPRQ